MHIDEIQVESRRVGAVVRLALVPCIPCLGSRERNTPDGGPLHRDTLGEVNFLILGRGSDADSCMARVSTGML